MINDLIVLGGGNAGLMSALYIKKSLPYANIKIIKSNQVGTIGVGEGSTEHWGRFADAIGITVSDLIRECGATIKVGIKFENWHGDGTSYFHSLPEYLTCMDRHTGAPHTLMRLIGYGIDSESLHWDLPMQGYIKHPIDHYSQFHFDSEKLNSFLEKKCIETNIEIIDTKIVKSFVDRDGYIAGLIDEDGNKFTADFFIDSSGFKRVIATQLGADWINWSKYLPLNSAIAFQTPSEEKIPTYTLAKSLEAGWHWRSPVQDRFGNGYVFSDAFVSEDQAIKEIQKYFTNTINIGRKINFTSGKVNKAWIKNCVCIGLSSNFVEPLEASSIATTIKQLQLLCSGLWNWDRTDTSSAKKYNDIFDDMMYNVLDFIQLHYFTQRNDTDFWKWCNNEIAMTDFNYENIERFKTKFVNQLILPEDGIFSNYRIYDCLNWIQVMHGLRMFDKSKIKDLYDSHYKKEFREYDRMLVDSISNKLNEEWFPAKEAITAIKQKTDYRGINNYG